MTDLDDILGDTPPKRRGRPPGSKNAPKARVAKPPMLEDDPDLERLPAGALPDPTEFMRPVRVTFLATIFGTEPRRLHKRLAKCPVIGWDNYRGTRVPVYDFKTACSYIVDPQLDLGTWIKSQTPTSLPPSINRAFWEAENSKLRWMERARHYWHDEDVLDVLGRTAMAIKETCQLWIENLPGNATMSTEQYEAMQRNVTDLLDDIHQRLVEFPSQRKTESVVRSLDDMQDSDAVKED